MDYEIIWSPLAIDSFEKIIKYLDENWTIKEINNFISKTEQIIKLLQKNPLIFRGSDKDEVREALITKHNLLLYQINDSTKHIELLTFWDTRQNPKKKFKD